MPVLAVAGSKKSSYKDSEFERTPQQDPTYVGKTPKEIGFFDGETNLTCSDYDFAQYANKSYLPPLEE